MQLIKTVSLIFIILNILSTQTLHPQTTDLFKTVEIDNGWTFMLDKENSARLEAKVPGTIHSDLLRHGLIEDPFFGLNEYKIKWIEEENWIYEATFNITSQDLSDYSNIALRLYGLDTFAEVSINGKVVINSDNMFISHEKEIKDLLVSGDNTIRIHFFSPTKSVIDDYTRQGINYPADNDKDERHLSVYARKAPYHYGWDWGLRMVTCGIWRPVKLYFYNGQKIDDVHTTTVSCEKQTAMLNNKISVSSNKQCNARLHVMCSLNGKEVAETDTDITLNEGSNNIDAQLVIASPQLWMPNGWGEQNLYDINITLENGEGNLLARHDLTYGIRNVEFVNAEDSIGRSFYFKVNGQPIFAKGANYIPQDIVLTNITKEDYERLFKNMANANMNMVRVWGGGIYEDDYFYELADRYGIMVWQDFMFGCSTYPATPKFVNNVRAEAIYNIKRLRNHPCLVLWCGNNEVAEGIKYWGWSRRYTQSTYSQMKRDYDLLFKEVLPALVKTYDSKTSYIHTSPATANWGRPETFPYGDSHYWGIWYGKEMFEVMDTIRLRFVSEFGVESFPEMKTIRTFVADSTELDIMSTTMTNRQKSSTGNETILHYITNYYNKPETFEDFVYLSQLVQGHGISKCIEANRRNRPVCMGSLYWQLNDCWPAISWSAIDYYGNKKALYYLSKKAFSPIIISVTQDSDSISLYAISDKLEEIKDCTISIISKDFYGNQLTKEEIRCDISPNTSERIATHQLSTFVKESMKDKTFLDIRLNDSNGKLLFSSLHYFVKPSQLQLPKAEITIKSQLTDYKAVLTLTCDCLAKDIFVEVPLLGAELSDNFFDLQPQETKIIEISGKGMTDEILKKIKITSLADL